MKTLRTLVTFLTLIRLLWVMASSLAMTDAATKALILEDNLADLANAYGNFCAGLSKIGHVDPATGTTTQIINGLINNGFMS